MCNYNGIKVSHTEFVRLKNLEKELKNINLYRPAQNGFEYGDWPVITATGDRSDFEVTTMEWGFIPGYLMNREAVKNFRFGYKKPNGQWQPGFTTLNAIGEEMLQSGKMYREAALRRRCLVFSSGFYEWRHIPKVGKKGQQLKEVIKYPHRITVRDCEFFFMAGIWQPWTDRDTGETVNTFAIVTTAANSLMAQVHNSKRRMPMILTAELSASWIFDDLSEERITEIASFQYSPKEMQAYAISKSFLKDEDPTTPFTYDELPELIYG